MIIVEPIRDGVFIKDGAYSLAVQVYVQNHLHFDEPIMLPYITTPTVQVGRFQNTAAEINATYIEENGVSVVRRDTGGGAIYLDEGGVNFCFVYPETENAFGDFDLMYQPAIRALKSLGLSDVAQKGRNDLEIGGKKISGAAMTVLNGRVYGGFSLLLDIDAESMVKALNPNEQKIIAKGIKSVRARVTDIRSHLAPEYQDLDNMAFKDLMAAKMLGVDDISEARRYVLTDEDWAGIDTLVQDKYANWEWNFGRNPRYEVNKVGRVNVGTVEFSLQVDHERIEACKIYGDFFGKAEIEDVVTVLVGVALERQALLEVLNSIDLAPYFGPVAAEDLVAILVK